MLTAGELLGAKIIETDYDRTVAEYVILRLDNGKKVKIRPTCYGGEPSLDIDYYEELV